jgi:hypothetical protein
MIQWASLAFLAISPFFFQILLIFIFFLPLLVRFDRCFSIFFIFSKKQIFCFVDSLYHFCHYFLILTVIFIISLLLGLGLACSCSSGV